MNDTEMLLRVNNTTMNFLLFYNNKFVNYSVSKVAIKYKAFKTFLPFLIEVSITHLRTANMLAL